MRRIHRSPVNSPRKGQWRGASMFVLNKPFLRINSWVNNRDACDLRRHCTHCDVIVMKLNKDDTHPRIRPNQLINEKIVKNMNLQPSANHGSNIKSKVKCDFLKYDNMMCSTPAKIIWWNYSLAVKITAKWNLPFIVPSLVNNMTWHIL